MHKARCPARQPGFHPNRKEVKPWKWTQTRVPGTDIKPVNAILSHMSKAIKNYTWPEGVARRDSNCPVCTRLHVCSGPQEEPPKTITPPLPTAKPNPPLPKWRHDLKWVQLELSEMRTPVNRVQWIEFSSVVQTWQRISKPRELSGMR